MNCDNFQEIERVNEVIEELGGSESCVGVRVNPQLGGGKIKETGTIARTSKFGVPMEMKGGEERVCVFWGWSTRKLFTRQIRNEDKHF